MRPCVLALLPALLAAAPSPSAKSALPFRIHQQTLANGLKVAVIPTGMPNLVSLQIPVSTGSRNEVEPGKSGFAHFFEHMMFRGTPTVNKDQWNGQLQRSGASQNAFTSDDLTNYHTLIAKEDLETWLRLEADRFQHLSYSEGDFKTESRAVLGEYNKDADAFKQDLLSEASAIPVYSAPKPQLQAEDEAIRRFKLDLDPKDITVTPVGDLFN